MAETFDSDDAGYPPVDDEEILTREMLELTASFQQIGSVETRRAIVNFVSTLARTQSMGSILKFKPGI